MRGPWLLAVLVLAWIGASGEIGDRPPARATVDRASREPGALRVPRPAGVPVRRALARPTVARGAAATAQPARGPAHGRAAAPGPVAAVSAAPRLIAVRAGSGADGEPARAAGRTLAGGGSAPRAPPRTPV